LQELEKTCRTAAKLDVQLDKTLARQCKKRKSTSESGFPPEQKKLKVEAIAATKAATKPDSEFSPDQKKLKNKEKISKPEPDDDGKSWTWAKLADERRATPMILPMADLPNPKHQKHRKSEHDFEMSARKS